MSHEVGHVVSVTDLGNYKVECQEPVPFKAELKEISDYPCYYVESLSTGKVYELYYYQIEE